ncbi:TonB-dependent receptor [Pseudoalteromonas luteoviolacea]|uniref:TonB-dependent receptor n=1 Tax=Pseudoalteromonas luteoviolacea TaxID=43657 RepID=UPI001F185870|nr:TonB-dependent receptor [Pseudoalteromonas luteoviolacea]MCF6440489.1 TonB-dependent receptor [Pseudoalteromonas luteoviolacea]
MQFSRSLNSKSVLATAVKVALLGGVVATAQAAEKAQDDIERISVYNKHNALILESGTATKSNMALMQTPAAVVIVDKDLLDSQTANTLQDAIRNVSGFTQGGNNYGIGDNLAIRGLGVNYTYDGMYGGASLGNNYNPTRSMTNIESMEVLKGPATGLYGIGAAGGVVNLIEKKPQFEEAYEISAKVGSWNTYGLMLDATNAITDDLAYRVVLNHERSDGYRDLQQDRDEVYASLKFEASKDHALLFSAAYIDDAVQVDSVGDPVRIVNWASIDGEPRKLTGADVPNDPKFIINNDDKKEYLGVQLTEAQREQLAASISTTDGLKPIDLGGTGLISPLSTPNEGQELRFKLRHDWHLGEESTLTQQILWRQYDSDLTRQTGAYNYVYWDRPNRTHGSIINEDPRAPLVTEDGVLHPYAARRQEYRRAVSDEQTWQYFADLQLGWSYGDISGEHLVSVNYEDRKMSFKQWHAYDKHGDTRSNNLPYILDIRNPVWPTGSFMDYNPFVKSNYEKSLTAYGISAQEVLYLTDALTVRAGAAYTEIKQTYEDFGTDEEVKELDSKDSGTTYNVGLNYQITPQFAAFINASKGRTAYGVLSKLEDEKELIDGTNIPKKTNQPDSESESFDLGFRFTAFEEDLLGSVVFFETKRTNLRYGNTEFNSEVGSTDYNVDVPRYFYDNNETTKGVEVDLNLVLNDAWKLNLNGTYQDAISVMNSQKDPADREVDKKGLPEKMAGAWITHMLPQFMGGDLELSLGMSYVSERTVSSSGFGLPTAVVDGYTRWDMAAAYYFDNYHFQLNIENLADETYYSKAMFLGGLPGNERNAKLTFNYQF